MATQITLDLSPDVAVQEPAKTTHVFKVSNRPLTTPRMVQPGDLVIACVPYEDSGVYSWIPLHGDDSSALRSLGASPEPNVYGEELVVEWSFEVLNAVGMTSLVFRRMPFDISTTPTTPPVEIRETLEVVGVELAGDTYGGMDL